MPQNPPTTTAFTVDPVAFGQQWAQINGEQVIADHDGVRITVLDPLGAPIAAILQTPDAAIALALTIQNAAVKSLREAVDENGRRPPLAHRLERINDAYQKALKP